MSVFVHRPRLGALHHRASRTVPLSPAQRWTGGALLVVAASLAAVAILGPLVTGAIDWRISELVRHQLLGLDAFSLLVAAPLAAAAGILALRGHPAAPVLAFGPAAYAAYMAPQYVLGPDHLGLAGNSQRLFPLLLVAFVAAVVGAVAAWSRMDLERLPADTRREQRIGRYVLPALAALVFGRYLATVPDLMSANPTGEDYLAGPAFVWTITLLDLGLALPATVAACVGIRRGAAWARRALYGVVAWLGLVGPAVAAMAMVMRGKGDEAMTPTLAVFLVALGLALAAQALVLLTPLLRRRGG